MLLVRPFTHVPCESLSVKLFSLSDSLNTEDLQGASWGAKAQEEGSSTEGFPEQQQQWFGWRGVGPQCSEPASLWTVWRFLYWCWRLCCSYPWSQAPKGTYGCSQTVVSKTQHWIWILDAEVPRVVFFLCVCSKKVFIILLAFISCRKSLTPILYLYLILFSRLWSFTPNLVNPFRLLSPVWSLRHPPPPHRPLARPPQPP